MSRYGWYPGYMGYIRATWRRLHQSAVPSGGAAFPTLVVRTLPPSSSSSSSFCSCAVPACGSSLRFQSAVPAPVGTGPGWVASCWPPSNCLVVSLPCNKCSIPSVPTPSHPLGGIGQICHKPRYADAGALNKKTSVRQTPPLAITGRAILPTRVHGPAQLGLGLD